MFTHAIVDASVIRNNSINVLGVYILLKLDFKRMSPPTKLPLCVHTCHLLMHQLLEAIQSMFWVSIYFLKLDFRILDTLLIIFSLLLTNSSQQLLKTPYLGQKRHSFVKKIMMTNRDITFMNEKHTQIYAISISSPTTTLNL